MAISRIAQFGPAAVASGTLSIPWSSTPAAGDTLVLNVVAVAGQSLPASIAGWATVFTNGVGAGFVSAQYTASAIGTESGNLSVMAVTNPAIAWVTSYRTDQGGKAVALIAGSYGTDTDDSATGIQITSASNLTTTAGSWIIAGTVWTSSSPTFPTVPVGAAARAITQPGATLGTIQNRASTTWLTNYRYNLSDIPVTAGTSGTVHYASNTTTASLQGLTNFAVLTETSANTPPIAAATLPTNVSSASSYAATDASTVTTSGATITSRTWRIVSGGGSLSSTTTASITVTAPTGPATQIIGIIVTDSNGMTSNETTYTVTVADTLGASAGPDQTAEPRATVSLQGTSGTSWTWRQISGTPVTLSSLTIQNPTFIAPATITGTAIVLGLIVSDGVSTSAEATITITVLPQIEWGAQNGDWVAVQGSNL